MTKEKFLECLDEQLSELLIEEEKESVMFRFYCLLDDLVNAIINEERSKNELQILFEYENHYLELIKEYKEEIKFSASLQEDLRRERSQFFTQILSPTNS